LRPGRILRNPAVAWHGIVTVPVMIERFGDAAMAGKRYSTRDLILAGLFSGLMIAGAGLRIQFPLVPLTFQPFFAILSGLLLGPSLGLLSQSAYILLGLVGIPVFAGGSAGLLYVLKPTFGFLIGFALSAWLSGWMAGLRVKPGFAWILASAFSGLVVLYFVGILYMYGIQAFYLAKAVTLADIAAGMLPFFAKDAVLFAGASAVSARMIPLLRQGRS
jgi:biotin transport system substrate-specific component